MINKKLFIKYMWYKGDYPAGESFTITTEKENSSNPRDKDLPSEQEQMGQQYLVR